jgi:hypothetical protein
VPGADRGVCLERTPQIDEAVIRESLRLRHTLGGCHSGDVAKPSRLIPSNSQLQG